MPTAETTILLADDHTLVREGFRRLLDATQGVTVIEEAADGRRAVEIAQRLRPDLVLMDIWMPGLSGLEATRQIVASGSSKVLILSVHGSRSHVENAFRAGASGYLRKTATPKELMKAIDAVASGKSYVSPDVAHHIVDAINAPGGAGGQKLMELSAREREVLQLVAEGWASKEIAEKLHISLATVLTHRNKIMQKLGIHRVSGLVRFAIREGMLEP